ncbi:MAG TPA: hypothetical protein VFE61_06670 [Candidatus Sulfotelmatobacter sp.]|nr:hypothetical protein [Candidatus Sulfotelmatobacter sp.]
MQLKSLRLILSLTVVASSFATTAIAQEAADTDSTTKAKTNASSTTSAPPPATITGSGTPGFLPDFTGAATIGKSAVFQSGASPTAKIGINTTAPTATLDVHGGAAVRGTFVLPATGVATPALGKSSQPENMAASVFNSGTSTPVTQTFQLKAEPANNNTVNASATLNLLFGQGTSAPTETGLKFNKGGIVTFVGSQTFPGTARLSGGNAFTGNQSVAGNISATGSISGSSLSGSGSGITNVNAAALNGFGAGAFAFVGGNNSFSGVQTMNNSLVANAGERVTGTIQFTDNGSSGSLQSPLLINAVDCCSFGDRMIWAHSPGFSQWGIYYDDDNDVMHWQESIGSDLMTLNFFNGDLNVAGAITAGTKDFKIDHPLDPKNKYLYHASVESSEMMNIYTGNATLDNSGEAVISLPKWFEAVNADFRYQLTAIGASAPGLYVAREVANHQFSIAGGAPGMKVSWQVTGVRHDAYAKTHPLTVEVRKPEKERGTYLHPDAFGEPRLTQEQMLMHQSRRP